MAAAINILFRGKSMGGGFLWGAFAHAFFVFNGGFTKQPQPTSPPSTSGCSRQSYFVI